MIVCVVLLTLACVIAPKAFFIKVLVRLLNEKELATREHSVLILIPSVVWISQYIHSLAINYRLIRYVREMGFVATFR